MKITKFDKKQTLTVEKDGVSYDVKIPAFCDCEEAIEKYIVAYVSGKESENAALNETKFDLSVMVNKEV